ncbi:MAG: prolyl oligopeptidase family serine peptidase [Undibacterium sp.]|nr:prolyl oligopeptidase family serine peptidase [Opitutaceae bacterium]
MPAPRLAFLLLAGLCLDSARGATDRFAKFVTNLYRPRQAEQVVLSPDGEHIAFTRHTSGEPSTAFSPDNDRITDYRNEHGELSIYIMAVGRTEKKFKIAVEDDRPVAFSKEKRPARLRFLAWSSPTRLVFAPTSYATPAGTIASIFAVNLDGSEPKTLAVAANFSLLDPNANKPIDRTTQIVGFLRGHREKLLVQALGRRRFPPVAAVPTTLFSIDVVTGEQKALTEEPEFALYFPDRTGDLRLLYTHPDLERTRSFRLKTPGFWNRWVDLDEARGGPAAKAFTVTPENYFGERAFPLGFDANPDLLYYASNVGRDTYGIYALDLRTRQRTTFAIEDPHVDLAFIEPGAGSPLHFDEHTGALVGVRAAGAKPVTRWIDPELAALQLTLDRKFPHRNVEILQWDQARRRFPLRVGGGPAPGRYYVFQQIENVLVELLRTAPWLHPDDLHPTTAFEFDTPSGVHLTGYLTFPRRPRINPPPLLIDFSDGVLGSAESSFQSQAQVLAELGFIVARVNHRGRSGFGLAHRNAFRDGGARVPVDDALAAIKWIADHHPIDRKRIATFGRGLGGYLALRALQLEPDVFRCAVPTDAPLSPELWLQPPPRADLGRGSDVSAALSSSSSDSSPTASQDGPLGPLRRPPPINLAQETQRAFFLGGSAKLTPVASHAETLTEPVMLILNVADTDIIAIQNASLRSKLTALGHPPEFLHVAAGTADLPDVRVKTFRQIGEFFNLNLYNFGVKVGTPKPVK